MMLVKVMLNVIPSLMAVVSFWPRTFFFFLPYPLRYCNIYTKVMAFVLKIVSTARRCSISEGCASAEAARCWWCNYSERALRNSGPNISLLCKWFAKCSFYLSFSGIGDLRVVISRLMLIVLCSLFGIKGHLQVA